MIGLGVGWVILLYHQQLHMGNQQCNACIHMTLPAFPLHFPSCPQTQHYNALQQRCFFCGICFGLHHKFLRPCSHRDYVSFQAYSPLFKACQNMHLPFVSAFAAWEFPLSAAHVRLAVLSRSCPSPFSLFELPVKTAIGKSDFLLTGLLLFR